MKLQKSKMQLLSALNAIATENGLKYDEMEHIVLFVLHEIDTQQKGKLLSDHLDVEQSLTEQIAALKKENNKEGESANA